MTPSNNKYINFESKPLMDVLRGEPGSFGIFIPKADSQGSYRKAITNFSKYAKARTTALKVKCRIETFMVITNGEIPLVMKSVMVTRV